SRAAPAPRRPPAVRRGRWRRSRDPAFVHPKHTVTLAEARAQGERCGPAPLDSRFRGNDEGIVGNDGNIICHARLILGSISDCSRSTTRLVATKTSDRVRIVPCNTGTSRLMIALLNRKPLPGQVNTVSTRIEPPSR